MIKQFLKITFWLLALIFFANILFLDFVWLKAKPTEPSEEPGPKVENIFQRPTLIPTPTPRIAKENQPCQTSCLEKIQEEVEKLNLPVSATASQSTIRPLTISFITIGSSGSTSSTSWADMAGTDFYFNLADYPNVRSVRWEINLRSFSAGNAVSARIYDVTNSRGVDGSELSTTSGSFVLLRSDDLTIWQGNNLYRVQAKTASGDPSYLDTPRLKILLE